jgi:hypothetical protein
VVIKKHFLSNTTPSVALRVKLLKTNLHTVLIYRAVEPLLARSENPKSCFLRKGAPTQKKMVHQLNLDRNLGKQTR